MIIKFYHNNPLRLEKSMSQGSFWGLIYTKRECLPGRSTLLYILSGCIKLNTSVKNKVRF